MADGIIIERNTRADQSDDQTNQRGIQHRFDRKMVEKEDNRKHNGKDAQQQNAFPMLFQKCQKGF